MLTPKEYQGPCAICQSGEIETPVGMTTRTSGIIVHGFLSAASVNLVERNVTIRPRTASGIFAGSRPAIVSNQNAIDQRRDVTGLLRVGTR